MPSAVRVRIWMRHRCVNTDMYEKAAFRQSYMTFTCIQHNVELKPFRILHARSYLVLGVSRKLYVSASSLRAMFVDLWTRYLCLPMSIFFRTRRPCPWRYRHRHRLRILNFVLPFLTIVCRHAIGRGLLCAGSAIGCRARRQADVILWRGIYSISTVCLWSGVFVMKDLSFENIPPCEHYPSNTVHRGSCK